MPRHAEFVNTAIVKVISDLSSALHSSLQHSCYNVDAPPYFHAQSLGYVSAATEYVSAYSIDLESANSSNTSASEERISTSIHPKYGGWFAYRILVVLNGVTLDCDYPRPPPLTFLSHSDRFALLQEYKDHPELGYWRDFHDVSQEEPIVKYDPVQFAYFHETCVNKRRRLVELLLENRNLKA